MLFNAFVLLLLFHLFDFRVTLIGAPNTQELSGEPKALEVKKAKGITQSNN